MSSSPTPVPAFQNHIKDPSCLIGSRIDNGSLQLHSILGTGSSSVVYSAIPVLGSQSTTMKAVKVLFKKGLSATELQYLRLEASLWSKISSGAVNTVATPDSSSTGLVSSSPKSDYSIMSMDDEDHANPEPCITSTPTHIAPLEKVIETSQYIFLVMEAYPMDLFDAIISRNEECPNSSTSSSTKFSSGFTDSQVYSLFTQLCHAVKHMHNCGVYHRDIKPENIMISYTTSTPENNPDNYLIKLTDFGLSTTEHISTDYKTGSTRYLPPESLGYSYDNNTGYEPKQCDIWALGIVLINLLFARNPWNEASYFDDTFRQYCETAHDPTTNVLCKEFPMTPELSELFSNIFLKRCYESVNELERDFVHIWNSGVGFRTTEQEPSVASSQTFPTPSEDSGYSSHSHSNSHSKSPVQRIRYKSPSPSSSSNSSSGSIKSRLTKKWVRGLRFAKETVVS